MEEHRRRMFENRELRRTVGLEREEVTGGWRKLHKEELHTLCSSRSIVIKSSRTRWTGRVARIGTLRTKF
jgi:hypothetical protein